MRKKKLYIYNQDDQLCIDMDAVKDRMRDDELTEKTVTEAVVDHDKSYFWCLATQDVGETGEGTCGKDCKDYKPRNGKFGACEWYFRCRMEGNEVVVKIKPAKS